MGTIELHALGNAVSTSVIASENLVRNNYATFQEIRTKTITVQASNNRGDSKKAKLFITLKRSPDFFENMRKFKPPTTGATARRRSFSLLSREALISSRT